MSERKNDRPWPASPWARPLVRIGHLCRVSYKFFSPVFDNYRGIPPLLIQVGEHEVPNYPNSDGVHVVQLAMSRDLKQWQRLGERRSLIGPSRLNSGAYDLTQILPPSAPVVRKDELWFYYSSLKYRAVSSQPERPSGYFPM